MQVTRNDCCISLLKRLTVLLFLLSKIKKNGDRPARLLLSAIVYSLPLEFGSNEYIFERNMTSFVRDDGRLFAYLSRQRLILY